MDSISIYNLKYVMFPPYFWKACHVTHDDAIIAAWIMYMSLYSNIICIM